MGMGVCREGLFGEGRSIRCRAAAAAPTRGTQRGGAVMRAQTCCAARMRNRPTQHKRSLQQPRTQHCCLQLLLLTSMGEGWENPATRQNAITGERVFFVAALLLTVSMCSAAAEPSLLLQPPCLVGLESATSTDHDRRGRSMCVAACHTNGSLENDGEQCCVCRLFC